MNLLLLTLYKSLQIILRGTPTFFLKPVSFALGTFFYYSSPSRREYIKASQSELIDTPEELKRQTLYRFRSFAFYLLEWLSVNPWNYLSFRKKWKWENLNVLDNLYKNKQGAILITSHTGNWEIMGRELVGRGYELHVIASPHASKSLTEFFNSLRPGEVVHIHGDYIGTGLVKSIKNGAFLASLIDGENVFTKEPFSTTFLGKERGFETFPVRLAFRLGVPVVPFYCVPSGNMTGRYKVIILDAVHPGQCSNETDFVHKSMSVYTRALEKLIKETPWAWNIISRV